MLPEIYIILTNLKRIFLWQREFETSHFTITFDGRPDEINMLPRSKQFCSTYARNRNIIFTPLQELPADADSEKYKVFTVLPRMVIPQPQRKFVKDYGTVSEALIGAAFQLTQSSGMKWHLVLMPQHVIPHLTGLDEIRENLIAQSKDGTIILQDTDPTEEEVPKIVLPPTFKA